MTPQTLVQLVTNSNLLIVLKCAVSVLSPINLLMLFGCFTALAPANSNTAYVSRGVWLFQIERFFYEQVSSSTLYSVLTVLVATDIEGQPVDLALSIVRMHVYI